MVCPLEPAVLSPKSSLLPSSHGTLPPRTGGSSTCGLWAPGLTSARESGNPQEKCAPEEPVSEQGLSRKRGLSKNTLSSSAPHSGEESGIPFLGHTGFWLSPSGPLLSSPEASPTGALGWRPESSRPAGLDGKVARLAGAVGRQHLSWALSPSVFSSSSSRSRTHIWACRMPAQNATCVDELWLCLGPPWEEPLPRGAGSALEAPGGASCLVESGGPEAQVFSLQGLGRSHTSLQDAPGGVSRLSPKQMLRNSTGVGCSEGLLSPIIHREQAVREPAGVSCLHCPTEWVRGRTGQGGSQESTSTPFPAGLLLGPPGAPGAPRPASRPLQGAGPGLQARAGGVQARG